MTLHTKNYIIIDQLIHFDLQLASCVITYPSKPSKLHVSDTILLKTFPGSVLVLGLPINDAAAADFHSRTYAKSKYNSFTAIAEE